MTNDPDEQYEWFLSQQCEGPTIDSKARRKNVSEWTFKETVSVLFAIFFVSFVICPFALFVGLIALGIVARLNGR
jgi:hypothetical protein